jgi:hypothetical protein
MSIPSIKREEIGDKPGENSPFILENFTLTLPAQISLSMDKSDAVRSGLACEIHSIFTSREVCFMKAFNKSKHS